MKYFFTFYLLIVIQYLSDAQVFLHPNINIDPRQYITIFEKNAPDKLNEIWKMKFEIREKSGSRNSINNVRDLFSNRQIDSGGINSSKKDENQLEVSKVISSQKIKVLDNSSKIEIHFDSESLSKNFDFFGNISLSAVLNDKPIEVNPYSLIGVSQKSYGVRSRPINELSSHFINLFIVSRNVSRFSKNLNSIIIAKNHYDQYMTSQNIEEEFRGIIRRNRNDLEWLASSMLDWNSKIPYDFIFPEKIAKEDSNNYKLFLSEKESKKNNFNFNLSEFTFSKFAASKETLSKSIKAYNDLLIESNYYLFQVDNLIYLNENIKKEFPYIKYPIYSDNLLDNIAKIKKFQDELLSRKDLNQILNYKKFDIFSELYYLNNENIDSTSNRKSGEIIENKKEKGKSDFRANYTRINTDYSSFRENLELCVKYMDYFEDSGSESINAFLNLSQMTVFEFQSVRNILKMSLSQFPKNDFAELINITSFRNTFMDVIQQLDLLNNKAGNIPNLLSKKVDHSSDFNDVVNENFEELKKGIAYYVGSQIFNKMLIATIDLEKTRAKNNDILEIKLIWFNTKLDLSKIQSNYSINENELKEGIELTTAKFLLKETGWNTSVTESAFLIKRINENLVTQSVVSPSDFKPSAGISLLWNYQNNYRNFKYNSDGTESTVGSIGRFFKWLEPSFGINVSYTDFSRINNYEIAAGPIIGLWQKRVFFTSGFNFGVNGQSPFYFGIGFSFSNIINNLTDKK